MKKFQIATAALTLSMSLTGLGNIPQSFAATSTQTSGISAGLLKFYSQY